MNTLTYVHVVVGLCIQQRIAFTCVSCVRDGKYVLCVCVQVCVLVQLGSPHEDGHLRWELRYASVLHNGTRSALLINASPTGGPVEPTMMLTYQLRQRCLVHSEAYSTAVPADVCLEPPFFSRYVLRLAWHLDRGLLRRGVWDGGMLPCTHQVVGTRVFPAGGGKNGCEEEELEQQ